MYDCTVFATYVHTIHICTFDADEDDLLFIGMQQVQGRQFDDLLLLLFLSALHA